MKRIFSLILALLLGLTGCSGPASVSEPLPKDGTAPQSAPDEAGPALVTLSDAVYPEFPKQPVEPEDGDWDAFWDDYQKYVDALIAIRGEGSGLSELETAAISGFAARSVPLVLAGHEGENAVYSPLSLWSALALLAQCAGGDSRQQVLDAIGVDSVDTLQEQVEHTWRTLYTDDGLSSLILANSIWLNSTLHGNYVQDTLDTLARKYYVSAYSVPMGTDSADSAVTSWVDRQTNGLIGRDAPVLKTMPDTLALLVSSLYYRASWIDKFDASQTEEGIFTDAAGRESRVDFMRQTQNSTFLRQEGWQASCLNTMLGEMVFVLPDEGSAPEALLQDAEFLSSLKFSDENAIWGEVQWSVPKFDVNSDLDLKPALDSMGITDLLDPERANLTALTDLEAFLSDAKQLARVKVDEEGVEAAAVTMQLLDMGGWPDSEEVCVMDLNRPFLFVIRSQDMILFIGTVNQM